MTDDASLSEFGEIDAPGLPEHFYFHVPFCRSKCSYCDFCSYSDFDEQEVFAVFAALEAEVRHWSMSALQGVVSTVYVGGGTPSLFAPSVGRLLGHTLHELEMRGDAEVTVEANPDSLSAFALEELLEGGANRISVGVQAFDDRVLKLLGRLHDARGARAALALVAESGAELSVDLMCGVPGQSVASWAESLEEALDSGARHVSVYPLSVEEGTPLAAAISGGLVAEPDPDIAAEMMLMAEKRFSAGGLVRYEVANYAAPGHESRHNTAYWTGRAYVGIGPGAHGMLTPGTARTVGLYRAADPEADVARVRYANTGEVMSWLMGARPETEHLTAEEAAREDVMLGMRLSAGVPAARVESARLTLVLESLAADGLTELAENRWRTTTRGWLLGNQVFGRIWAGE